MENNKIITKISEYPMIKKYIDIDLLIQKRKYHFLIENILANDTHTDIFLNRFNNLLRRIDEISKNTVLDVRQLQDKLSNTPQFFSTIKEIEWAIDLYEKNLLKEIEPQVNGKTPDFRIEINKKEYYIDIFFAQTLFEQCVILVNQIAEDFFNKNLPYRINVLIKKSLSNENFEKLLGLLINSTKLFDHTIYEYSELHFFENGNYCVWNNSISILKLDMEFIQHNPKEFDDFWKSRKECIAIIIFSTDLLHGHFSANPYTTSDLTKRIMSTIKEKSEKYSYLPLICIVDLSNFPIEILGRIFASIDLIFNKNNGKILGKIISRNYEFLNECPNISAIILSKTLEVDNKFIIESQIICNRNPNAKFPLTDEEARLFGELMN